MIQETAAPDRSPSNTAETQQRRASTSSLERIGLAAGIVMLLFLAFRMFAFVHDDAFITYRYAWHLQHGFGPVFNPGD